MNFLEIPNDFNQDTSSLPCVRLLDSVTAGYVPGLRHVGVTKVLFIKHALPQSKYTHTLTSGARQWRFLAYA